MEDAAMYLQTIAVHLLRQLAVFFIFIYLFSRYKVFRKIMTNEKPRISERIFLIVFFSAISILGTYTGFPVKNAIANTRAVGIIVAGLVAGPIVGTAVGVIAGVHRYFLGGLTIVAALISAAGQGMLSGYLSKWISKRSHYWFAGFMVGGTLEILHMLIVIAITRPLEPALELVQVIGPPMIVVNAFGVMAFIAILENVYNEQERIQANAAEKALKIANLTLPVLRKGLNYSTAEELVRIIFDRVEGFEAICVVSRKKILASILASDKGIFPEKGEELTSDSVLQVIETGDAGIVPRSYEASSTRKITDYTKVIVPLKEETTVVGALIMYKPGFGGVTVFELELARGLARLISTQLEISKRHYNDKLVAQAEVKALQAQINPHFLFNAINTIVYYCMTDAEKAKDLMIFLGDFYRSNLTDFKHRVDLETEIRHVNAYVRIEMARFRERLKVNYDIKEGKKYLIPPLILQPLVENAIKHGVLPKKEGGTIAISSRIEDGRLILVVEDDGVGTDMERIREILKYDPHRKSIGLYNVFSRLKNIYNKNVMIIESELGKGTKVTISIPIEEGAVQV